MNESISFPVCDEGSLQVGRLVLVVQQLEGITHPGCKIPALGQECSVYCNGVPIFIDLSDQKLKKKTRHSI